MSRNYGPESNPNQLEFIRNLEASEEQCLQLFETVSKLDSINRPAVQDLIRVIQSLLHAEVTRFTYPEKYDPLPKEAQDALKNAVARLGLKS